MNEDMTKKYADIGKRLAEIRSTLKEEPKEIAERLGIEVAAYRMYERGDRKISTEAAKKLSEQSYATVEYIYYGLERTQFENELLEQYREADKRIQESIRTLLGMGK